MDRTHPKLSKVLFAILCLASVWGWIFSLGIAWYTFQFLAEPTNPHRHEYAIAVTICNYLGLFSWILTPILTFIIRKAHPPRLLAILNLPIPITIIGNLVFYFTGGW